MRYLRYEISRATTADLQRAAEFLEDARLRVTFYFACKTALFGQQMKSEDWDRLSFDI